MKCQNFYKIFVFSEAKKFKILNESTNESEKDSTEVDNDSSDAGKDSDNAKKENSLWNKEELKILVVSAKKYYCLKQKGEINKKRGRKK